MFQLPQRAGVSRSNRIPLLAVLSLRDTEFIGLTGKRFAPIAFFLVTTDGSLLFAT